MSAFGPIGALAICEVQTVRRFSFEMTGGVAFAGTVGAIIVRAGPPLVAALNFAATLRENTVFLRTTRGGFALFSGILSRALQRAPLRFARRKGIITRGVDR